MNTARMSQANIEQWAQGLGFAAEHGSVRMLAQEIVEARAILNMDNGWINIVETGPYWTAGRPSEAPNARPATTMEKWAFSRIRSLDHFLEDAQQKLADIRATLAEPGP